MDVDLLSIQPTVESLAYLNGRSKRLIDILGALIGIILCVPIFAMAAMVVKFVDKVPFLFAQQRVGLYGKSFVILKLRTLKIAETRYAGKLQNIHKKPDYETTRTGKFWRITSIDEIIQFLLVLNGQMSLIGHRPIPVYYVPYLAQLDEMDQTKIDHYLGVIYQYKPGMSSLSAVNGRGDLTMQQKFVYDMIYAREATFWYDLKLLFQTVYVVINRKGAK